MREVTPEMRALLKACADPNTAIAYNAQYEFVQSIMGPLRQAPLVGDTVSEIYQELDFTSGDPIEFALDPYTPGLESEHVAYTCPNQGRVPERTMEGDYLMVPTYSVCNSVDWLERFSQAANWPVVDRFIDVFKAGFVKKNNDDGWHTLIGAGVDRNILVYDSDAAAGQFTKRLVSLMKVVMRRNGGGNSTSINRGKLTHMVVSPEAQEGMRNWGVDQLDDISRREIYVSDDGAISRVFSVNLMSLDEIGVGQEYQTFFTNVLGASLQGSDVELVIGLDLANADSFVRPMRAPLVMREDVTLMRQFRQGVYGKMEGGWAILDNRRVILGSL